MSPPHAESFAPPASARRWTILPGCALVLLALGVKLWIIRHYATQALIVDDWDALAAFLLAPFADSTLTLSQLFAAHNEHRIFTTRVISLLLFVANGGWDPLLQMIVNAAIHVALGVAMLVVLGAQRGRAAVASLALVIAILLATPNATENPVWGIET